MTQYDKEPYISVSSNAARCAEGWAEIAARLGGHRLIVVECYPGVFIDEVAEALTATLRPSLLIRAESALRPADEIERMLAPHLTDDPVFGVMNGVELHDFFAPARLSELQREVDTNSAGPVIIVGTGATLIAPHPDLLVYANLARWTIQGRQRRNETGNLGAANLSERPSLKYKRAFFVDWRAADRLKQKLYDRMAYVLDTSTPGRPLMISGDDFRRGLAIAASRPFRVVPLFDPGPWGGRWMMERFELDASAPNYAWCFDCVPEENSLLLGFGHRRVEIPAIDLVFRHPRELLGEEIVKWLGPEFPIRFDFLDTMEGGNLSLQVHPLAAYIRERFGMAYTQDESYYLLDAAPDAQVFLGLKESVDRSAMLSELRSAQEGKGPFCAERYVNGWPAKKHDHFLIPAGTIHCSGRNSMVLEISATPYIFTFKLWDWGRLGLDGRPRPIHLDHGAANIQWDRTTEWIRRNLVGQVAPLGRGEGWREERTGLHPLEFIETRRHWFTGTARHETNGTLNVLNCVDGDAAVVESPEHRFEPFVVHYAETFIVPAAVGRYTISPLEPARREMGTIKAYVRNGASNR